MGNHLDRPLIGYLPPVLQGVREYRALAMAEQPEVAGLFGEIQNVLDNQFLSTLTEHGVRRWEGMLAIEPKATYTLGERKFTIMAQLSKRLPYTMRMLEGTLSALCGPDGYTISLDMGRLSLHVDVKLTAANNVSDVGEMLRRMCPANLSLGLSIEYNQHYKLQPFTHAQLGGRTHHQIRNEVL